jgi:hypothetical protein
MTTQLLSQYEEELLIEIRQIPLSYLPNLLKIVRLFRDSVSSQQKWLKKEREEDTSVASLDSLDDMNPKELSALLDIQSQYEAKDRLREREPMRVDFDVIQFEDNFPARQKKGKLL